MTTSTPALAASSSSSGSTASSASELVRKPSLAGLPLLVKGLVVGGGLLCSHNILHSRGELQRLASRGNRHDLNLLGDLRDSIRRIPFLVFVGLLGVRPGAFYMLSFGRKPPADLQALTSLGCLLKGVLNKRLRKEFLSPDWTINEFFRLMTDSGVFQYVLP